MNSVVLISRPYVISEVGLNLCNLDTLNQNLRTVKNSRPHHIRRCLSCFFANLVAEGLITVDTHRWRAGLGELFASQET
jgi:hypothetical protein